MFPTKVAENDKPVLYAGDIPYKSRTPSYQVTHHGYFPWLALHKQMWQLTSLRVSTRTKGSLNVGESRACKNI
jgi:hypothetical protein